MTSLLSLLFSALIGFLAWPHAVGLAPLVLVALPFWNRRHWSAPFLSMFGYHLATTDGLIHGTVDFFPHAGMALGIAFWVFSSLAFALPYLLYRKLFAWMTGCSYPPYRDVYRTNWHEPWWRQFIGGVAVTIILSAVSTVLPPLGLIGWTSPWIGAIASGWWAIPLVLLAVGTGAIPLYFYPALALSGVLVLVALLFTFPHPHAASMPKGWVGIDSRFGELSGLSYVEASMKLVPVVLRDLRTHSVVLLPESIAGPWLPGTRAVWRPVLQYTAHHPGKVVLVGADIPLQGASPCPPTERSTLVLRRSGVPFGCVRGASPLRGASEGLSDALVKMQDGREKILPDRIPVPFSMWHPWRKQNNFPMRVFGAPEVGTVDGVKVGYLICYEQLLVWPALALFHQHIRVLLAPANDWWAQGTTIPAIQHVSAQAWAHFLGVPVLFAVNR